jgi:hypothetical protein
MTIARNIGTAALLMTGLLAASSALTTPAFAQRAAMTPTVSFPTFNLNFDRRTSNIWFGHGPAIDKAVDRKEQVAAARKKSTGSR